MDIWIFVFNFFVNMAYGYSLANMLPGKAVSILFVQGEGGVYSTNFKERIKKLLYAFLFRFYKWDKYFGRGVWSNPQMYRA
jgi:hypothetical protein